MAQSRPSPHEPTRRARSIDVAAVDAVDCEIPRLLGQDGRVPFSRIAAAVDLSEAATTARVRRLEERGVITGFGFAARRTAGSRTGRRACKRRDHRLNPPWVPRSEWMIVS
jgi:predicted transcriptional regulator